MANTSTPSSSVDRAAGVEPEARSRGSARIGATSGLLLFRRVHLWFRRGAWRSLRLPEPRVGLNHLIRRTTQFRPYAKDVPAAGGHVFLGALHQPPIGARLDRLF